MSTTDRAAKTASRKRQGTSDFSNLGWGARHDGTNPGANLADWRFRALDSSPIDRAAERRGEAIEGDEPIQKPSRETSPERTHTQSKKQHSDDELEREQPSETDAKTGDTE